MGRRGLLAVALITVTTAPACYDGSTGTFPDPDYAFFEANAYPVLLRDCGFTTCHANADRFFNVYGPGRLRLDPETGLFDDGTIDEIEASYDHARAMLVTDGTDVRAAPLLRKPREGAGHAGLDAHGNNVYAHESDPGYAALEAWAMGQMQ